MTTRRDVDGSNGDPAGREAAPGFGRAGQDVGAGAPSGRDLSDPGRGPDATPAAAFRDLALVHGPDLETWPEAERASARAFAAAEPRAAAEALAEAAELDAALGAWASEAAPLSGDLLARLAADADATLPGVLSALPAPAVEPRRGRPAPRPAARAARGWRPLARFGAPAAFAASAALGVALGYANDDPVSQGFAALAMGAYEEAYDVSLLDVDLLSEDAFPDAETVR
ncbi:hypothetical protein P2H44_20460 [Albimonas sp. CAU 1670]|uniref:hypothetical protein n=1 Tax=Albimonas sp. CAU 1670 TaxID=3032599 RepID=UPI0023DA915C|nr:hypothetical protein [Albimonas sp. CAU 1670]MDF2234940.1 hypothetical protein [Albimonas sp. CAU 1670]